MEVNYAYLSLGSNVGDAKDNLLKVIKEMSNSVEIDVLECSKFYATSAWGYTSTQDYVNCCVRISTPLTPIELLDYTQELEKKNGRTLKNVYSDRKIDIDIIIFNDIEWMDERLTIPHRFWLERNFVLYPLRDLTKNIKIRGINYDISTQIQILEMKEKGHITEI